MNRRIRAIVLDAVFPLSRVPGSSRLHATTRSLGFGLRCQPLRHGPVPGRCRILHIARHLARPAFRRLNHAAGAIRSGFGLGVPAGGP